MPATTRIAYARVSCTGQSGTPPPTVLPRRYPIPGTNLGRMQVCRAVAQRDLSTSSMGGAQK
eukprot:1430672-Rhodomonas_salina.1